MEPVGLGNSSCWWQAIDMCSVACCRDGSEQAMKAITWGAVGLVVGAVGTGLLMKSCADKAVAELQAHAKVEVAKVVAYADSLEQLADSLKHERTKVIKVVDRDTTSANIAQRALAIAKTARDSVRLLLHENISLRSAQLGLFQALAIANQENAALRQRGDSLQTVVIDLRDRIEKLKPRPKWVSIGIRVTEVVVAFKAGWEAHKAAKK